MPQHSPVLPKPPTVDFAKDKRHNQFMLLEKVKRTIATYGMFGRSDAVLVAVSGGIDSVVLLDSLCRLAGEFSLKLVIGHLDHGLRGKEAKADAQFVASLGKEKGLPVIHERIDVRKVGRENRLGLEEAGRMVRRRFLEDTADQVLADRIALGHTLNDRAETLLFNLIRGAGPTGLAGIRPVSPPYIRPLIGTKREEILAFARAEGLTWREDRTNQDTTFSRNRIRHQLLPLLRQMNPRLLDTLERTADLLLEERNALDILLERPWKDVVAREEAGNVAFRRDQLSHFPRELQGLLLRKGIARARGTLQGVKKIHVDALRDLVTSTNAHAEAHLPGLTARVQGDELFLSVRPESTIVPYELPVELGRTEIPRLGVALELAIKPCNGPTEMRFDRGRTTEIADADRVHFPLCVRSRREGDRFRPLGMSQEKRLKDLLIDVRIPFYEREAVPLLCDQDQIVWVVGVRLSDAVRVTPKTKRALVMRFEELA